MSTERKPDLPDPGLDRWWEIACDSFGDFQLKLWRYDSYRHEEQEVCSAYVSAPAADRFEQTARALMIKQNQIEAYVGVYRKA